MTRTEGKIRSLVSRIDDATTDRDAFQVRSVGFTRVAPI